MKIKVYNRDIEDINERVFEEDDEELLGGWSEYIKEIFNNKLKLKDINKRYFIIGDGAETILLKDGRFINICVRPEGTVYFEEDDEDIIYEYIMELGLIR